MSWSELHIKTRRAADLVVKYCTQNLPRYYHADAFRDIQVLTPMQRGVCGAANLNQLLQETMNPTNIFLKRGGTQYRLHDKVMQIKNDYDKEVFNGDIGIVVRVDTEDGELVVDFDVLIGEKKAISYAVRNETTTSRNTKLAERLRDAPVAPIVNRQAVQTAGIKQTTATEQSVQIQSTGRNKVTYFPDQNAETLMVAEPPMQYGGSNLFDRLAQSKFRSSFSLKANDRAYYHAYFYHFGSYLFIKVQCQSFAGMITQDSERSYTIKTISSKTIWFLLEIISWITFTMLDTNLLSAYC